MLSLAFVLGLSVFTVGRVLYGGSRGFDQPWASWLQRALFNSDSGFYDSVAAHGSRLRARAMQHGVAA